MPEATFSRNANQIWNNYYFGVIFNHNLITSIQNSNLKRLKIFPAFLITDTCVINEYLTYYPKPRE